MTDGAKIVSAVQQAFMRIGTRNGHAFPEHEVTLPSDMSNERANEFIENERAAYRFMVAGELRSIADKSYKEAKQAAEDRGLFNGVDRIKPGSSATLYTGPIVSITASVNNPTTKVDIKRLRTELRKRGVAEDVVAAAVTAATQENAPAKRITATPVL